jgi:hypothetical protein
VREERAQKGEQKEKDQALEGRGKDDGGRKGGVVNFV